MCKILVVDDESDVREGLCIELASLGHDVVAAGNGLEALHWLGVKPTERPCMVLLDLRMPTMDGWDFIEHLRSDPDFATLPVIVLSATLKRGSHAPVISAQAFWQKPPTALNIENIDHYCAQHRGSGFLSRGEPRASHVG
jgi:CheY-like chemotaxis protein